MRYDPLLQKVRPTMEKLGFRFDGEQLDLDSKLHSYSFTFNGATMCMTIGEIREDTWLKRAKLFRKVNSADQSTSLSFLQFQTA